MIGMIKRFGYAVAGLFGLKASEPLQREGVAWLKPHTPEPAEAYILNNVTGHRRRDWDPAVTVLVRDGMPQVPFNKAIAYQLSDGSILVKPDPAEEGE